MRELRLELQGKTLIFPDGKVSCLACGGAPDGVRRVWFEDLKGEGASLGMGALSKATHLSAAAKALQSRITFNAPLCRSHRARARWFSWGTYLCGLAFVGMILLSATLSGSSGKRGKSKESLELWLTLGLGLIPALPGYFLWQLKDRGGLACTVRREGDSRLVLTFPDEKGDKPQAQS